MKKLELKHLAGYLPYGLRIQTHGIITSIFSVNIEYGTLKFVDKVGDGYNTSFEFIKPILKNPYDLMEDGYTLGMIMKDLDCPLDPVLEICEFAVGDKRLEDMSVASYEVMCGNHIDFGGLIEGGLAVDGSSLGKDQEKF